MRWQTEHCDWFTKAQIQQLLGEGDAISRTVELWQRADIIRGKGKAGDSLNKFLDDFQQSPVSKLWRI